MEFKKIKIDSEANSNFRLTSVQNWDAIVENVALVVIGTGIREYETIDVTPKVKSNNIAVLKYVCVKKNGELDEYILNFDILGCSDLGYNAEVSKVWRGCLNENFGNVYADYVLSKLSKHTKDHTC